MRVGIVTDSTCDLTATALLRSGVAAVPLKIALGEELYRDWRDLAPSTLYDWMQQQDVAPSTLPADSSDFIPVYKRFLNSYDHIVSIHLSGKLSDTLGHAIDAANSLKEDFPDATKRIHFIDSGSTATALGDMVLAAAKEASEGAPLDNVIWAAERIRDSVYTLMSPASTRWLVREGHISKMQGAIRNLLQLRLIMSLNQGELRTDTVIPKNNTVPAFIRKLQRHFGETPLHVAIGFAGTNNDTLESIKRALELADLNIVRGRVQHVGPVMSAYLGPGSITLSAYPDLSASLLD